jgi:hypothetical protein
MRVSAKQSELAVRDSKRKRFDLSIDDSEKIGID